MKQVLTRGRGNCHEASPAPQMRQTIFLLSGMSQVLTRGRDKCHEASPAPHMLQTISVVSDMKQVLIRGRGKCHEASPAPQMRQTISLVGSMNQVLTLGRSKCHEASPAPHMRQTISVVSDMNQVLTRGRGKCHEASPAPHMWQTICSISIIKQVQPVFIDRTCFIAIPVFGRRSCFMTLLSHFPHDRPCDVPCFSIYFQTLISSHMFQECYPYIYIYSFPQGRIFDTLLLSLSKKLHGDLTSNVLDLRFQRKLRGDLIPSFIIKNELRVDFMAQLINDSPKKAPARRLHAQIRN